MHAYDLEQLAEKLDFPPRLFLQRENGRKVFPYLHSALKEVPEHQPLLLVFPADQIMDVSFADETVVRLGVELVSGLFGDRALLMQNLTGNTERNIDAAISLQRLKLALLSVEGSEGWHVLGQLEDNLRDTLAFVSSHGCVRAQDLAAARHLEINAASNRLKRLYDQRLIQRESEVTSSGLQYAYHFWKWRQ